MLNRNRSTCRRWRGLMAVGVLLCAGRAYGWDEFGHVLVTRLAVAALPDRMPAWLREPAVRRRLEYLSAEPDRWRGQHHVQLDHVNNPEHFIDEELLHPFGLSIRTLPPLRRQYLDRLASHRTRNPDDASNSDGRSDPSYTRNVPGLLPYRIAELQWFIASSWSTLKTYERCREHVTEEMLENARQNVVFHMGILSHYVGDGAQPLHTTKHYNGWAGENPNGYTTSRRFHAYIDEGVLRRHGITAESLIGRVRPAADVSTTRYWEQTCGYLYETFEQVEPLYVLERSGDLDREPGRRFMEERLLEAGSMLAGVWAAGYEGAVIDDFLVNKLTRGPQPTTRPAGD